MDQPQGATVAARIGQDRISVVSTMVLVHQADQHMSILPRILRFILLDLQ